MCGGLLRTPKNICGEVFEPRVTAATSVAALSIAANKNAARRCNGAKCNFGNLVSGMLRYGYPNERGYQWHKYKAIELAAWSPERARRE